MSSKEKIHATAVQADKTVYWRGSFKIVPVTPPSVSLADSIMFEMR